MRGSEVVEASGGTRLERPAHVGLPYTARLSPATLVG